MNIKLDIREPISEEEAKYAGPDMYETKHVVTDQEEIKKMMIADEWHGDGGLLNFYPGNCSYTIDELYISFNKEENTMIVTLCCSDKIPY